MPKLIAPAPWQAQESILPGTKLALRVLPKKSADASRVKHDLYG